VDDPDWLAERFEENRARLRAVAYRILGSLSDAEDAVQEAWLRQPLVHQRRREPRRLADHGGREGVAEHAADTQVTARGAARGVRAAEIADRADAAHPEDEALLADMVGPAFLVILDTLDPAERLAFVLHDMFAVPFDEIAPIVGRTPAAARQLASRARRRVQGADTSLGADRGRQREIVAAFLAASRNGQFDALLALLDPAVMLRADDVTVEMGAAAEVLGASAVAETFSGRARAAQLVPLDGEAGAMGAVGGLDPPLRLSARFYSIQTSTGNQAPRRGQ
jgi:RNA polymerase sigma factor (sigma-70 family)